MSYISRNLPPSRAYTDDEWSVGIQLLFEQCEGHDDASNTIIFDEVKTNPQSDSPDALRRQLKISRAIAFLSKANSAAEAKNKMLRVMLLEGMEQGIIAFAIKERLSESYVSIAKNMDCPMILIFGYLKKIFNINLSDKLISSTKELCLILEINQEKLTPYLRTASLLSHIKYIVTEVYGYSFVDKATRLELSRVLATLRLHYSISDIKHQSVSCLISQLENCNEEKLNILKTGTDLPVSLYQYQKHVPFWRYNHKNNLLYYFSYSQLHKIKEIFNNVELEEYSVDAAISYLAEEYVSL